MIPSVNTLPAGSRGFDCNTPVTADVARRFVATKYQFALRYIWRDHRRGTDLSVAEVLTILRAGLALSVVQHYEGDGWYPTDAKGTDYGRTAVVACRSLGLLDGMTVWLDLESPHPSVGAEQIIRYVNRWADQVTLGGFQAGLYGGYGVRLTPDQLYRRLKVTRYMGAYNQNSDQVPAVRGNCMKQLPWPAPKLRVPGVPFQYDEDVVLGDKLGGSPAFLLPWAD